MSETTHTPGPWRLGARGIEAQAFEGSWKNVVDTVRGGTPEQAAANKRLIMAAPDLLLALKALVETLQREAPGTALNNHRFDALGIQANNAIAKAEGRS